MAIFQNDEQKLREIDLAVDDDEWTFLRTERELEPFIILQMMEQQLRKSSENEKCGKSTSSRSPIKSESAYNSLFLEIPFSWFSQATK